MRGIKRDNISGYVALIFILFMNCPSWIRRQECCFMCVVSQPCEWRASEREVLVCGPAAGVWDHPSGKRPIRTPKSVGDTQNTWTGPCWYNPDILMFLFLMVQRGVFTFVIFYAFLRGQSVIHALAFLLFGPRLSLMWTRNRKLCATSTNWFFVSFPWWQLCEM